MTDDKYIQQPPGQAAKAGSWVYDENGKLVSVDGVPVPEDVVVYLPGKEPKEKEEEDAAFRNASASGSEAGDD